MTIKHTLRLLTLAAALLLITGCASGPSHSTAGNGACIQRSSTGTVCNTVQVRAAD